MAVLKSCLPKRAYLVALKGCMMSPFAVFSERMTGIVIGSFFSIAHYCPYEWNRPRTKRITNECNRAWGWVKATKNGTEVHFIRGKGLFSPFWLGALAMLFVAMAFFTELYTHGHANDLIAESGMVWLVAVSVSAAVCGLTAFQSTITDRGIAGAAEITRMLRDPSEYYC